MTTRTTWTFGGLHELISQLTRDIDHHTAVLQETRHNLANALSSTDPDTRKQITYYRDREAYLNRRLKDLKAQLKEAQQSPYVHGRRYTRSAVIRALRKWPQITHAAFVDNVLQVVFIPVLVEDICSTLLGFKIRSTGTIQPLSLPPDYTAPAHPHMGSSICLGNAAEPFRAACNAGDLFAAIAVLQEYRLTHNPNSELEPWRSRAVSWWRRDVYQQPQNEILGWDGHTVAALNDDGPETIDYVESIYKRPLSQILSDWEAYIDNEDEDECRWHCDVGDHCSSEDYANNCLFCGEYACDDCIWYHYETVHEAGQCEHMKPATYGGGRYQCETITTGTCQDCPERTYICDDCIWDHNEEKHPKEEEEEDEPILPNVEQPGQLQLMTILEAEDDPTSTTIPLINAPEPTGVINQ